MQEPKHLTNAPPGGVLIAWHRQEDIAAYDFSDRSALLVIRGKMIESDWAPQMVVNLCHMDKPALEAAVRDLLEG